MTAPLWIPIGAAFLSALMSLISTYTATRAISANIKSHKERILEDREREARQAEAAIAAKRGKLYEATIISALKDYLSAFIPRTRETLLAGLDATTF
jgi:heme exporter protein D